MNYLIVSIDDSRLEKKNAIRRALNSHTELIQPGVNGRNPVEVQAAIERHNAWLDTWTPKVGELGVWLSMQDAWKLASEHGPLIVLEDDAIVSERFDEIMGPIFDELPEDWDFFALFVPDNQYEDYFYNRVAYDERGEVARATKNNPPYRSNIGSDVIAKSYQGYSCVGMMYSKAGGQKLLDLARQYGMYTPVDCFIFQQVFAHKINGYAHHPEYYRPVTYDWHNSPTLVQDTEILQR